jgi:hypothetical protein
MSHLTQNICEASKDMMALPETVPQFMLQSLREFT